MDENLNEYDNALGSYNEGVQQIVQEGIARDASAKEVAGQVVELTVPMAMGILQSSISGGGLGGLLTGAQAIYGAAKTAGSAVQSAFATPSGLQNVNAGARRIDGND